VFSGQYFEFSGAISEVEILEELKENRKDATT
jgi:hypothetical protein